MWKAWPLVAAAAFGVIAGASLASAQTVIARNVPANSTMELVLNETKVGTASPDPLGDARIPFKVQDSSGKPEMDANVHVDICDTIRRGLVVERAASRRPCLRPAAPAGPCWACCSSSSRSRISPSDAGAPNPTVWLRQGSVDLTQRHIRPLGRHADRAIVFGGAGVGKYSDQPFLSAATWWTATFEHPHDIHPRRHVLVEPIHRCRGRIRAAP